MKTSEVNLELFSPPLDHREFAWDDNQDCVVI